MKIRPTRQSKSFYLLIPSDIAKLLEIDEKTEFNLSIERDEESFSIIYRKSGNENP